jgi:hypothetical protein
MLEHAVTTTDYIFTVYLHWIWLMCEVAEKFEFVMMRTVNVCPKTGVGRGPEHKNPCFRANFQKSGFGTEES